jgi:AcrR family transcriptional regulator
MARTKVFDPAAALEAAMEVFWQQGYEATSTDDLLSAMKIGRQSMYDTFGDKRQLYLAALAHYVNSTGQELRRRLTRAPSPLRAIEGFLLDAASGAASDKQRGCMSVNAVCEFGQGDRDVFALLEQGRNSAESLFAELLSQAKAKGELPDSLDTAAGAHFLHTTIRGMRISAKAGASQEQLSATAAFAIAALRALPASG